MQSEAPSVILVRVDDEIRNRISKSYDGLVTESVASAGLGLGSGVACCAAEVFFIILRFFNCGLVNYKIKVFLFLVSWK